MALFALLPIARICLQWFLDENLSFAAGVAHDFYYQTQPADYSTMRLKIF